MKKFSAQFILTNRGPALKRGIVTTNDDGTIIRVDDTGGDPEETRSVEFHNGTIVPGFVNCHCHIELSHLKGAIPEGKGLAGFLKLIGSLRETDKAKTAEAILLADREMYSAGIVLCADICNSTDSFNLKKQSRIKYINLLEVFGIDPQKAEKRFNEILDVSQAAGSIGLEWWLVPHTVYTVSKPLFSLLRKKTLANKITSLHYMESEGEEQLLRDHSGPLMEFYRDSGYLSVSPSTVISHASTVLDELTQSGNLILVHNTYADSGAINDLINRKNLFWCLCPCSNIYIEGKLPPVDLFREEKCEIVIGTDSLASNQSLNILEEIRTLQVNFPHVPLEEIIRWATINGARALGEEEMYGSIEPGKNPGLLLLENIDLQNLKLLPETRIKRLI